MVEETSEDLELENDVICFTFYKDYSRGNHAENTLQERHTEPEEPVRRLLPRSRLDKVVVTVGENFREIQ